MIDLIKEDSGLWVVTLNRPDKANALTAEMLQDLIRISQAAKNAKALIFKGEGKVFSAGADLDEARAGLATSPLWEELSSAVADLPCLTIAALNGTLAGGANGMALACDLRISVPTAKVFYPVMSLGFLPQPSDVKRMSELAGPARAKLILMAGQKITAQEAYDFGLIDRIVAPENLMKTARDLAALALAAEPDLAAQIKAMCNGA